MIDKKQTSKLRMVRNGLAVLVPVMALSLAAVFSFFLLDEYVFSTLRQQTPTWHSNEWVEAFKLLGKTWVPIWLILLWFCFTGRLRLTLIGLLALLLVAPTVNSLKILVRRPRPRDVIKAELTQQEVNGLLHSWSFPSGDTASVFAVATALVPFVGWYLTPVFFAVAAGVGFLRVVVLAHYPSDVCGGAAVGIFCGWLALQITRRWPSLQSHRFDWCRGAAVSAVILIPILFGLYKGLDQLLIFLKTYGLLTAAIYIIVKAGTWSKRLWGRHARLTAEDAENTEMKN
jgi:undecaprenyl-diphosphatase